MSIPPGLVTLAMADSRLPTGGHVHWAGWRAPQAGLPVADTVPEATPAPPHPRPPGAGDRVAAAPPCTAASLAPADADQATDAWAVPAPAFARRGTRPRQGSGMRVDPAGLALTKT